MHGTHQSSFIRNAATLTIISILISGCLMGEEEAESGDEVATDNEVSGSVGDGPVIGANMRILRNDGVELMQLDSDANASYNIKVKTKGKYYPLGIDARNGTDIVTNTAPDFDLLSAVFEPGKKSVANVNPFSTFAVELARDLAGGESKANLETAQGIVSSEFNNGLTSLKVSGPMRTKVDGSNIAEIVRAGILAVSKGQWEASQALGASRGLTLKNVIIPQALRVIVPPLTSQYLNITKNSSLAIAIGYMDVVATIGGISLMQTGKEMETMIIVLTFYLVVSLLISAVMNWFNQRIKLVER